MTVDIDRIYLALLGIYLDTSPPHRDGEIGLAATSNTFDVGYREGQPGRHLGAKQTANHWGGGG